jgi:hypothetical protein
MMNTYVILRRGGWRTPEEQVDEIIPVADTVIVRPDPQPAAA